MESAINVPTGDRSPPVVESAVNVATGDVSSYSPVTIKPTVNVDCSSYSPLTIERATPSSEGSLEVIKSENSNSGTGPSDLVNVLWAGDVYSYNVPSFNVLTVALRHIVISFVDQGFFQKVDLHARQPRDFEPRPNFAKSHSSVQS